MLPFGWAVSAAGAGPTAARAPRAPADFIIARRVTGVAGMASSSGGERWWDGSTSGGGLPGTSDRFAGGRGFASRPALSGRLAKPRPPAQRASSTPPSSPPSQPPPPPPDRPSQKLLNPL